MKERPLRCTAEEVRAILEGRKTQTRRVMASQPHPDCGVVRARSYEPLMIDRRDGEMYPGKPIFGAYSEDGEWGCKFPFGQPGDQLWVRETWGIVPILDCNSDRVAYRSDYSEACGENQLLAPAPKRWRPSIHMPRWASRITLEITAVRVERLHDISEEDAKAEGVNVAFSETFAANGIGIGASRLKFWSLWESIYGTESRYSNPWVWAIEFRRVKP